MRNFKISNVIGQQQATLATTGAAVTLSLLLAATPALAHHTMDGRMPSTLLEGFLSGVAHPLIGPDHFAFIVSVGLLAAVKRQGLIIPAFLLAAMVGTGAHLAKLSLPGVELLVSASILLFGAMLVMRKGPNAWAVAGLAAIAGLFHGYAYGESIFGAEQTPVVAYLAGFTAIQLAVSMAAFWMGRKVLGNEAESSSGLRSTGLVIAGMGVAFLANHLLAIAFPMP